jgi:hypothetical protein
LQSNRIKGEVLTRESLFDGLLDKLVSVELATDTIDIKVVDMSEDYSDINFAFSNGAC